VGSTAVPCANSEAIVVAGDAVLPRDLVAVKGRFAGWRAAARPPFRARPPEGAIDTTIGLRPAIDRRRGVYAR
jgi:hypothetical protein